MYEFWYDYVKSKYEEKSKIMLYEYRPVYSPDKNVLLQILQKILKTRFNTSNYKLEIQLLGEKKLLN